MSATERHTDWLSLVEHTGPFLALPVLESVFPQGLDVVEAGVRRRLRSAYDEWREAIDESDPQLEEFHREWVKLVFEELLEYDDTVLKVRSELDPSLSYTSPEQGWTIEPDMAVISDSGDARLLISVYAPGTEFDTPLGGSGGIASPLERMTSLCKRTHVRIGLVTNGERWTLVNAPSGGSASGYASWYAGLWFQETSTLHAFYSLLGVRRCFGPADEALDSLLERSIEFQEEVTDTLGQQVRRAVEVLVQALDRADEDRNRELLRDVEPRELYEAGLTVMMRLVFVLCAEERGLLLRDDSIYDNHYAMSPLRSQLAEDAARIGPEVLERRHDAWSRLLAVFRAIYGGIEHDTLRLPALGGSLFDPDRFPFLEGRPPGTNWMDTTAEPLPIDNRTVLMLLSALQILEQPGGALSLSYKALDVEQIGHVYEGLLEYTVARVPNVTLGLVGSSKAKNPNVALAELESAWLDGERALLDRLIEVTGRSESTLRNALAQERGDVVYDELLQVSGGDAELADRVEPFANLLRKDNWGDSLVYREGAFNVTLGTDRRETGTHYTPKSIAESVVETTLEPLAYVGPTEGAERKNWRLNSPAELLDLKVCDPAMGSGAFLVQACRWLAGRLVDAWQHEEARGKQVTIDGEVVDDIGDREPMPTELDERVVMSRRLVAERCLYGVDMNPLAVELAKLSLWLTTLAKGRPFGFLDHNLKVGDSLLGIHRLDQLLELSMRPGGTHQHHLFGKTVQSAVRKAVDLRERLRAVPVRDIRDVQAMSELDAQARAELNLPDFLADAFIGVVYAADSTRAIQACLSRLSVEADRVVEGDEDAAKDLKTRASTHLAKDAPNGFPRRAFHWPLEFPEVFQRENGGLDAFVGNPPFLGGKRISTITGPTYSEWLVKAHEAASKNADLVAHFFLRAFKLVRNRGHFGFLAVNTIAEGDTRQSGLEWLLKHGATIYAAYPNEPWPGTAAVVTSRVHVRKGEWSGVRILQGYTVPYISPFLSAREEWSPKRLKANEDVAFIGSFVNGMGFVLSDKHAKRMLDADSKNADVVLPYLNGDDINTDPQQIPNRWVINFWDWPEARAKEYRLPYEWIKRYVYLERFEKSKKRSYQNIMSMWWLHWRSRSELYHAIGHGSHFERRPQVRTFAQNPMERVLAVTRVSKTLGFSFVRADMVFSDATVVFATDSALFFGILQSNVHACFAWHHSSRLKNDLRYSPTDAFEPFVLPSSSEKESLRSIGEALHEKRRAVMLRKEIGLTKFYKRIHDLNDNSAEILELRELHRELDVCVANAYGWGDLDLGHDMHAVGYLPEKDKGRFTISEAARFEILERLSELNRQRYEEEVTEGLHGRTANAERKRARRNRSESEAQTRLFDGSSEPIPGTRGHAYTSVGANDDGVPKAAESRATFGAGRSKMENASDSPSQAILDFLLEHCGWYAKSGILAAVGIGSEQWKPAIDELLDQGVIERQGRRRGTRYRAVRKAWEERRGSQSE